MPAIIMPLLYILGSITSCRRVHRYLTILLLSKLLLTSLIGYHSLAR
jgi:hypothetical protein